MPDDHGPQGPWSKRVKWPNTTNEQEKLVMQYRNAPAHIRAAISRQWHRWETPDGTPAAQAMHDCLESDWRWLDCDECDTCEIRVCVDCGADIDEPTYEFTSKEK